MITPADKGILRHISKRAAVGYAKSFINADETDWEWISSHATENYLYDPIPPDTPDRLFCTSMYMVGCSASLLAKIYGVTSQSIHQKIRRLMTLLDLGLREAYWPTGKDKETKDRQFTLLPICKDIFNHLIAHDACAFGRLNPSMIGSMLLTKATELKSNDEWEIEQLIKIKSPSTQPKVEWTPEQKAAYKADVEARIVKQANKRGAFSTGESAADILAKAKKLPTNSNLNKVDGHSTELAPLTEERTAEQDAPLKADEQKALDELFGS